MAAGLASLGRQAGEPQWRAQHLLHARLYISHRVVPSITPISQMGKPRLESKEAYSGFTKPQSWGSSLSRPGFSDSDYLLGLHFTAEETASELSNRRGVAQLDPGAGGIGARPRRRPRAAGMQRPGPHSGHRLQDGLVRPARRVRGVPGRVEPEDGEEVWEDGREGAWGSRSLSRPGQREPRLPSRPAWVTRLARTVP